MVTMQDIAADLKLSKTAVCYALGKNWRTYGISARTRQTVLRRSHELGYRRNRIASSLSTRTTHTIGVIVPRIADMYADMVQGIETEIDGAYTLLLGISEYQAAREQRVLESFEERMVDGLIIVNAAQAANLEILQRLHENGLPIVQADRHFDSLDTDVVEADGRRLTQSLTQHLLKLGHRRIAFLNSSRLHSGTTARREGYEAAMTDCGMTPLVWFPMAEAMVGNDVCYGRERTRIALESDAPPTAIVSSDQVMAIGSIRALRECTLRCPEDMSVTAIGLDGSWRGEEEDPLSPYPLTRMVWSVFEMGRRAGKLLLERMESDRRDWPAPRRELLAGRLIPGESIARPGQNNSSRFVSYDSKGPIF
jgi:LacI family transcriptional regulator